MATSAFIRDNGVLRPYLEIKWIKSLNPTRVYIQLIRMQKTETFVAQKTEVLRLHLRCASVIFYVLKEVN